MFIRPISAPHSRTNCWRLPVCELRRFLHRNNPVCCECCCVCVPAAVSPQQDNRANGMKPLLSTSTSTSNHFYSTYLTTTKEQVIPVLCLFRFFTLLFNLCWKFRTKPLDRSKSSVLPEDTSYSYSYSHEREHL